MFSLIITIISIALVAALALATIYYGGTAFNKGTAEAKASQLINEGQQINGAVALNRADARAASTTPATDVSGLAPSYLAQVPATWSGAATLASGSAVTSETVTDDVCKQVNKKAGSGEVIAADAVAVTGVYGCHAGTSDPGNVMVYKF